MSAHVFKLAEYRRFAVFYQVPWLLNVSIAVNAGLVNLRMQERSRQQDDSSPPPRPSIW